MDLFQLLGTISINNSAANKALDSTSAKGQQTQGKLSKVFTVVGKGAMAVGKTMAVGLGAGAAAMGGLVVKALNLSGELEQNMGGSEAVFKEYAGKMQETARKAFSNMGLSTANFLATANKMGALFQGAGFDIETSARMSSDAMQRAADVASIMGISTESAMEAIAGAAKGNFTMMDNLGVAMNDTTIQAYAMSKGINKSTSEMTNQEKIALAMEMFMEKTAYAAGNYAKENQTLAGSLSTAKAALINFLDGSGDVDSFVTACVNAANVIVDNVTVILPRLISGLNAVTQKLLPHIPRIVEALLPGIVEGAVALLVGLAQILPDLAVVLLQQIPVIIGQIRSTLESQFPQLKEPFAVIEGLFNGIWQSMQIVWESIGKPIFDALATAFGSAKTALQPFIDAFSDYVTGGGFAADATTVVTAAVDALKTAYETVTGLITGVVNGFKDIVTWAKEHETAMTLIGIAIGTVTAAIAAYNIAMAIKKAGGLAEIIQLGVLQVQLWALTAAETAHTVATTIGTAATTAFGAAMAFLTSPITLVVLAIGALIAIVVLCVKNWDKIKEAGAKAWEGIKNAWSKAVDWFKGVWEGIKNVFSKIGTWFSNIFTSAKNGIQNAWAGVKNFFSNIKDGIVKAFSNIKDKLAEPFNKAKEKISEIADKIKGFFKGEISMPKIKTPKFAITPSGWKIGDLLDGVIPKLSIKWNAKGAIMKEPTLFGYNPATGTFQGGGEAGDEAVAPIDTLQQYVRAAVKTENDVMASKLDRIIGLLAQFFPEMLEALDIQMYLDGDVLVAETVDKYDTELGKISIKKGRGR